MAAGNTYDIGDRVRLETESPGFTTLAGTPTNPSTVTVMWRKPDGTEASSASPTNDGPGMYHHDIDIDQSGTWYYRWKGTGAVVAAADKAFQVRKTPFLTP